MTQRYTYADPAGAWSVDLGTQAVRLGSLDGFSMPAELGGATGSGLEIDNPSATVGHSNDAIVGDKFLFVDELAETVGNRRLYAALTGKRRYTHAESETDSLRLSTANHIHTDLIGIQTLLGLRKITGSDGNRSAESVGARLTWIIASSYLSDYVDDRLGYVVYPGAPVLDANDYRPAGSPLDVLTDCALAVGYNCFLIWNDETATKASLYFDDINTSAVYTSAYRLSNAYADIDSYPSGTIGATKTFSFANTVLERDPERVASTFIVPYRKGYTSPITSAATAAAFIARDLVAPSQSVKSLTNAVALGNRLLADNATEADTLEGSVDLPAAHVNAFREGQLISAKDTHAPGYSGFNGWRIIKRTVKQTQLTPDVYTVDLVLTPVTTPITCDDPGNVDLNVLHGTVTGYTDAAVLGPHTGFAAPLTPANMNDGNDSTTSSGANSTIEPQFDGPYYVGWHSDLGSAYTVACMDYKSPTTGTTQVVPSRIEYSSNDIAWTDAAFVVLPSTPIVGYSRYVLAASHLARYWRITAVATNPHNLPYGYGYWAGIIGHTWKINGQ